MIKPVLIAISSLLLLAGPALAQTTPQQTSLVSGSEAVDFKIMCWNKDGKLTWGIYERPGISEYNVARNIELTPLGDGRLKIQFLRGFTSATHPDTYIAAADERCEATEK